MAAAVKGDAAAVKGDAATVKGDAAENRREPEGGGAGRSSFGAAMPIAGSTAKHRTAKQRRTMELNQGAKENDWFAMMTSKFMLLNTMTSNF